jgi:Major capsid protein Gp23
MSNVAAFEKNKQTRRQLVEKWSKFLDRGVNPVKGKSLRENTAMLMESQYKYFTETTSSNGPGMASYLKVTIPMIRRVFPELIANEICGVQPMSGPTGLAFAMRYRFADAIGSIAAGDEAGYNSVDPRYTGAGTNIYGSSAAAASANGSFDATGGDVYSGGKAMSTSAGEFVGSGWSHYSGARNFPSTSYKIPEMEISIESETIRAGTRKLKATWTLEMQQDLANVHNLDIDNEMTGMMSYQIQAEIDREIIGRMIATALAAGNVSNWAPITAAGRWMAEVYVTLYYQILVEANAIAITTRRNSGNFIICSPTVVAALQTLEQFQYFPVKNTINSAETGLSKVGVLDGRLTVYRDTFATSDYVLVGYKGNEEWDSGIIYCPYIPLLISRTQGEDDFMPRIGVLTRYGVTQNLFGADLYYRLIKVDFSNSGSLVFPTVKAPFGIDANNAKKTLTSTQAFPKWS